MIQDLPLLPAGWTGWNWSESNGIATAAQTQNAYYVAVNKGQCALFSRLVWNDIVDCLAMALEVAGIGWNNKYCSAEACKINVQYGGLTATAFNSVRYNIDRFGIVHWTWATRESKEGYLGRVEVRGVERYEDKSDKVYGWYLVELTERLNMLLKVLKNTADFSEFEYSTMIAGVPKTDFGRAKISTMGYVDFPALSVLNEMDKIAVRSVFSDSYAQIEGNFTGKGIPSASVTRMLKVPVLGVVEGNNCKSAPMWHSSYLYTRDKVEAFRIKTGILDYDSKSSLNIVAELQDIVFVGYLKNTDNGISHVLADLENYKSSMAEVLEYVKAKLWIALKTAETKIVSGTAAAWLSDKNTLGITTPKIIHAVECGKSAALSTIVFNKPEYMGVIAGFNSASVSYPQKTSPMAIEHESSIWSSGKNELHRFRPVMIGRYAKGKTVANTIATLIDIARVSATGSIRSVSEPEIKITKVAQQYVLGKMNSRSNAKLVTGIIEYAEARTLAQSIPSVEGESLQAKYAEGICTAESFNKTDVLNGRPKGMSSTETSGSFYGAKVQVTETLRMESSISAEVYELAKIAKCESLTLKAAEKIQSYFSADLAIVSAKVIQAIVEEECSVKAEISKDTKNIWKDPVYSGKDLYIRSAHPQWQEDNTVHLDGGGVFYDVEKSGTNVYIRSVDSMKGV